MLIGLERKNWRGGFNLFSLRMVFYNKIITLENSNENIKLEVQKKLRRDFGE